jgi:hypothetical protein
MLILIAQWINSLKNTTKIYTATPVTNLGTPSLSKPSHVMNTSLVS